jgi:hypothetical protein
VGAIIEAHHDVRSARELKLDALLRRQDYFLLAAVGAKNQLVFAHFAEFRVLAYQREHLEAAGIGQYRPVPA